MNHLPAKERSKIISLRFVHRDIKPSNYTVGREQTEWIYLIDFGICREIMVRRGKECNGKGAELEGGN